MYLSLIMCKMLYGDQCMMRNWIKQIFIISKKWQNYADKWYHKAERLNIENFYPLKESHHKKLMADKIKLKDTF